VKSALVTENILKISELGVMDYLSAWDLQKQIHQDVVDSQSANSLLLLEHPSVYTAGRRTEILDRPLDDTPVIDVDRGGKITWHGLGQLVGYPLIQPM